MPFKDRDVRRAKAREYTRAYRERNPERSRESTRASMDLWRSFNKQCRAFIEELKGHGCVDCGNKDPRVLQFDHVRGVKRYNVTRLNSSLGLLKIEAAKCDVVCANCHAIRTFERRRAAAS